jgi:hypothetical protein
MSMASTRRSVAEGCAGGLITVPLFDAGRRPGSWLLSFMGSLLGFGFRIRALVRLSDCLAHAHARAYRLPRHLAI